MYYDYIMYYFEFVSSIDNKLFYYDELVWFGLVSLFNGIFNAKAILLEEQLWYSLIHNWEDTGINTFP